MRALTRRLSTRVKRVAAATVVLGVTATGTAHALTISGIDVIYDGVAQGSGYGYTMWDGRPLVSATWADKQPTNAHWIYANASFYQYRYTCALGSPCRYAWMFVNQANGPDTSSKISGYGLRGQLSGYSGTYAAYLNICADVAWRVDPCATRGRTGF
ncbi:hypothetical protein GCM10027053_20790 [Intrasporangium mesophilum]